MIALRALRRALLLTVLGSLICVGSAGAAMITVNTTVDEFGAGAACSLREAIASANGDGDSGGCVGSGLYGADVINFDATVFQPGAPQEVIDLSGINTQLVIGNDTQINGPGMHELAVDGPDFERVFLVNTLGTVGISGLEIVNGFAAVSSPCVREGGGIYNFADLTLDDVYVANNKVDVTCANNLVHATSDGGGIYQQSGILNVFNSVVENNTAQARHEGIGTTEARGRGGGIYGAGGSINISQSTIGGNTAKGDKAIGNAQAAALGGGIRAEIPVEIDQSTISNNTATTISTAGGDAFTAGGGLVFSTVTGNTLQLSTVAGNRTEATATGGGSVAENSGGGVAYDSLAGVTVVSSTIADNGRFSGGAMGPGGENIGSFGLASTMTLNNTIVADPASAGTNCDAGGLSSQGFNFDHSPAGASCGFAMGTDKFTDPLLGTLGSNLGLTAHDAAPAGQPGDRPGQRRDADAPDDGSARPDAAGRLPLDRERGQRH